MTFRQRYLHATGREGTYEKNFVHEFLNGDQRSERFSLFVQDPAKQQTILAYSQTQVAIVGHWPYWSGRKGCWADEHGQHPQFLPTDQNWYKVPISPEAGKLETIASIPGPSGDKPVRTRVVTENLGHKEIHGLAAYGMRTTMTPLEDGPNVLPEATTELWKSSELGLKLLQVTNGPKYGSEHWELSDLQRGDPDPELFAPPPGYRVDTIEYHQVPCGQKSRRSRCKRGPGSVSILRRGSREHWSSHANKTEHFHPAHVISPNLKSAARMTPKHRIVSQSES